MKTIKINGKSYTFNDGETILSVARRNKVEIPSLCFLKDICEASSCRICMVEDVKSGKLITSCSTLASDNMEVLTESERVVNSRIKTLNLLSKEHDTDCDNCEKNNRCKLQSLFNAYDIFTSRHSLDERDLDTSSPCVERNNKKCILCDKCRRVCSVVQTVDALTRIKRGNKTQIGCAFNNGLKDSTCVGCGQCTLVCPTAALLAKSEVKQVKEVLLNKELYVTCQVAPSVRVSLSEAFGKEIGAFDEEKMVEALHKLGFKMVFDVNMGADFTVIEESNELLERIKSKNNLPQFSSCCPAWFKFVKNFYPEFENNLSSCKSPTEMLGALVKNYYSKRNNIDSDKIVVVDIMPCTAKKGERERAKDVDYVLTTRELAKMIKEAKIDFNSLKGEKFDSPLSSYSGAALIFGVTGGVTEAVLRNVMSQIDDSITDVDFEVVRNSEGRKDIELKAKGLSINLCVVNGLKNAREVLEEIKAGKKHFDFIEVMACPGGCVNGGGQNLVDYDMTSREEVIKKRSQSIYEHDKLLKIRKSRENTEVQNIYKEFLVNSDELRRELFHYRND